MLTFAQTQSSKIERGIDVRKYVSMLQISTDGKLDDLVWESPVVELPKSFEMGSRRWAGSHRVPSSIPPTEARLHVAYPVSCNTRKSN